MKAKAVIFDLFGTLVGLPTYESYYTSLAEMARAVGADPEEFSGLWHQGFNSRMTGAIPNPEKNVSLVCQELGLEPRVEHVKEAVRIRLDFTRGCLSLRPDAVSTLAELKRRGYKLGLITNCSTELPNMWEETPFAPYMETVVFSSVEGLKKPDSKIYHLACERLDVQPEDCVFVGDGGSNELAGARAVGMTPILIRVPEEEYGGFRVEAEDWEGLAVEALGEVLELV